MAGRRRSSSTEPATAATARPPTPPQNQAGADPTPDPVEGGAETVTCQASCADPPAESLDVPFFAVNLTGTEAYFPWNVTATEVAAPSTTTGLGTPWLL